jgi:hypothetical protein
MVAQVTRIRPDLSVARFYVQCRGCGVVAPPSAMEYDAPLRSGMAPVAAVYQCASCGEYQPYTGREIALCNIPVRCARHGCHACFLVPATANIVCCPQCTRWQAGPAGLPPA